ncbi:MAG: pyrroloquinoline quinone biosynthesis protein B [Acidobacteria bacterium]|nr:MAG: pyrroloquinoline quinone biosynthesis protein B [Acidobacteriota bacterium]
MRVKVLGSAAGGGFPQWNCACPNCSGLRNGSVKARPRTQTQIAIAADPEYALRAYWTLINASPDLRWQIVATPELAPFPNTRSSTAIMDVYLQSADVDALMGLLHLREFQAFKVFSMPAIRSILSEENSIFRVLGRASPPVQWFSLPFSSHVNWEKKHNPDAVPQFTAHAVSLSGEYPDYIGRKLRATLPAQEAVIALAFEFAGKRVFVAPTLPGRNTEWKRWAESSDLVLIDGTFWSDDELLQTGRSKKTARQIGHLPISGPGGLMDQYPKSARGRKVLIHINNTNPILNEVSPEHRAAREAGWEIAYDGMEFNL